MVTWRAREGGSRSGVREEPGGGAGRRGWSAGAGEGGGAAG